MAAQQASPKALLNVFLGRVGVSLKPSYAIADVKNDQGHFECTCTIPAVITSTGSLEGQSFMGEGPSKKLAASRAAESAWAFVQGTKAHEAFKHKLANQDLWASICSALTPEARILVHTRPHLHGCLFYVYTLHAPNACHAVNGSRAFSTQIIV